MKRIANYIRLFWQKDFHPQVYGISLLFIAIAITLNYLTNFEDGILDSYQQNWWAIVLYFLYYAIPYFFVICLYLLFLNQERLQFNQRFWLKSGFAIVLLSAKVWFFYHLKWFDDFSSYQDAYLYNKISNRIINSSFYIIGLFVFYRFFEIDNKNLYGLKTKEFNFKPYFLMLALMVPLLIWASFQPDFLQSYPRLSLRYIKDDYWKWFSIFEPLYLGEFITLEWFFRGFLVVGMVKLIGHRAVLPMAILYCTFHFGKPLGECIGSLFGGYILGIIAFYTRSVWGGVIVHMGIALLMDLFAIGGHFWWG